MRQSSSEALIFCRDHSNSFQILSGSLAGHNWMTGTSRAHVQSHAALMSDAQAKGSLAVVLRPSVPQFRTVKDPGEQVADRRVAVAAEDPDDQRH